MSSLSPAFLEKLATSVGPEAVSTAPQECDRLAQTTLPEGTRPAGIVRPANRDQVQQILKLTNEHRIPVYPISCGKNWGYGDACAPKEGSLILDLSRMNRILEVNAELAYAVIEPGVTQGQLASYLEQKEIPLILDGNGAGPDASLVGNILERGFGHSRYGDRFAHCCNIEAVLSDGTVLTTGYGAYSNAQAQHVYKHGVGPSLDGLFTQSNVAVTTRMTIWLQTKPECINFFFITLKHEKAVGPLMDRLRRLFLAGTLRTTLHCFNDRRLLASEIRFPWDKADGQQALELSHSELLQQLYKEYRIPCWAASGSLSGSAAEVATARKTLRHALQGLAGLEKLVFLNHRNLRLIKKVSRFLGRFSRFQGTTKFLDKVALGAGLLEGNPSYLSLKGAHWRARTISDKRQDPLDSGAGLIWVSPVVPMKADALERVLNLSEPIFHEFGFEFQVTVSCLNERALCAVMSICFDHTNSKEMSRARQCEEKLLTQLLQSGFVPYRASPAQQALIRKFSPESFEALKRLKMAWDPGNCIAPGRYLP